MTESAFARYFGICDGMMKQGQRQRIWRVVHMAFEPLVVSFCVSPWGEEAAVCLFVFVVDVTRANESFRHEVEIGRA